MWVAGNVLLSLIDLCAWIEKQVSGFVMYVRGLPDRFFDCETRRRERIEKKRDARWERYPRLRWLFAIHEFLFPLY